jgi:hypothetical protein
MGDACNVTMQRIKQGLDRLHAQRLNMQPALNSLAGTFSYTGDDMDVGTIRVHGCKLLD